jgi:hypothetical protein
MTGYMAPKAGACPSVGGWSQNPTGGSSPGPPDNWQRYGQPAVARYGHFQDQYRRPTESAKVDQFAADGRQPTICVAPERGEGSAF